jgi:predicted nucleic-acid-binding protein
VRAIDTNILVRFLVADDREQHDAASAIIEGGDIFVPTTVLLESAWVMRSTYRFGAKDTLDALESLAGMPEIKVENAVVLADALALARNGLDFADALHLAASEGCETFITFDRALVKAAEGKAQLA